MKFQPAFRASAYLSLCIATLSLGVTEGNLAYAGLVALASLAAYYLTDKWQAITLPRLWSNVLALIVTAAAYYEYRSATDLGGPLLPVSHWLVYLQLVRMFHRKRARDYWYLYVVGILQVAVASALNTRVFFGVLLAAYLVVTLWSLVLFFLWREGERYAAPRPPLADPDAEAGGDRRRRSSPIVTARLAGGTLVMSAWAILWAIGFFFFVPRMGRTWATNAGASTQAMTGFDVKIELGELGEIMENDDQVFRAKLLAEDGRRIVLGRTFLWRGIALTRYERGRWTRNEPDELIFLGTAARSRPRTLIRQVIEIEPLDAATVFGLSPIVFSRGPSNEERTILYDPSDGALYRKSPLKDRRTQYVLYSSPQELETGWIGNLPPSPDVRLRPRESSTFSFRPPDAMNRNSGGFVRIPNEFTDMPPLPRLVALAKKLVAGIPGVDHERRARALERYFAESGEFGYTLAPRPVDTQIDPVEDFLFNRKEGHCEYFASALALMLRAVGIPSRVINGFKGGDWNQLGSFYQIRQKHAHSWVEAYIGPSRAWLTLDPEPGTRGLADPPVRQPLPNAARMLGEYADRTWGRYFIDFDAAVQSAEIYRPLQTLGRQGMQTAVPLLEWTRDQARMAHDFVTDRRTWTDWRGIVVVSLIVALLVALVLLLRRTIQWLIRVSGLTAPPSGAARPTLRCYARLLELLGRQGLRRAPAETPLEFARSARERLFNHSVVAAADVPAQVVASFYAVRFGQRAIAQADEARLMAGLDSLERAIAEFSNRRGGVRRRSTPQGRPVPGRAD